jgi:signal transduction histidine kinase
MTLFSLDRAVGQKSRPDTLHEQVHQVLEELSNGLGYNLAFVALANARSNALEGAFGVNVPPFLLESLSIPLDNTCPLVQTLRRDRIMRVEDALMDSRMPDVMRGFCASAGIQSLLIVPLSAVSGALVLSKEELAITDDNLGELLTYISRLVLLLSEISSEGSNQEQEIQSGGERDWLWFMVNSVPHPLVMCDEWNSILMENIHAERLFKANPEDSEGKRHAIELNSFLFSAALSSFSLDQGPAPGRELTLVDPIEGSELLYEMICRPAINPRTGERGVVAFLENVTDLKRALTELQRSFDALQRANEDLRNERDNLNLILENVENPIIVASAFSDIILMNSAAERLLQLTDASPANRVTTYSANDARLTSFLAQFHLETGDVKHGELQLDDPSTGLRPTMSITATKARDQLGRVVAIVCILQDLTRLKELERRRLEHQLFESEKLAAVGRLAAAVAHEVNNPLEAIKNSLHLVSSSVAIDDPHRRFLDIANSETQRVSSIIRQMLSFYRPGSTMSPVDVNFLINEVTSLLQAQFKSNIVWQLSLSSGLPPVIASGDKLKQVFLNLFLNACEAMDNAGEVRVVTRTSGPDDGDRPPGKYLLVEVSDSGMGIPEEHLSHVFDPFFSTKRERHGTGLGLWVSQDIVNQHGGQIEVKSEAGYGATFTVVLPLGVAE